MIALRQQATNVLKNIAAHWRGDDHKRVWNDEPDSALLELRGGLADVFEDGICQTNSIVSSEARRPDGLEQ